MGQTLGQPKWPIGQAQGLTVGQSAPSKSAVEGLRETIAQQQETIRHQRSLLADERRRMLVLLTGPARVPWWRRCFR
jgi:hypothetical protein